MEEEAAHLEAVSTAAAVLVLHLEMVVVRPYNL